MKNLWLKWGEAFSALTMREKSLISLSGVVVIGIGFFVLLLEPAIKTHQTLTMQVQRESMNQQRLESEMMVMQAQLNRDPDAASKRQLSLLQQESQQLTQELEVSTGKFISPSQMATLLEMVLAKSNGIELVSMESLPAEPFGPTKQDGVALSSYYIHPVKMVITGGYFDVADYLKKLENLPVTYFWRDFQYQVERYPTAIVTLEVYTLGTRQEFIGG